MLTTTPVNIAPHAFFYIYSLKYYIRIPVNTLIILRTQQYQTPARDRRLCRLVHRLLTSVTLHCEISISSSSNHSLNSILKQLNCCMTNIIYRVYMCINKLVFHIHGLSGCHIHGLWVYHFPTQNIVYNLSTLFEYVRALISLMFQCFDFFSEILKYVIFFFKDSLCIFCTIKEQEFRVRSWKSETS